MYKSFFGLRESPFNANPDPRFLYLTPQIHEALAGLAYGIRSRKGFLLLTGEVGTGKTTLLNRLLDWLNQEGVATAYVFHSQLDATQLFDFMMADFGIPCQSRDKSHLLMKLNQWLLQRYRDRKTSVLIVDEAQNLTLPVLEEVRLLTNFETASEKLLQIILCGQPELDEKLRDPRRRELAGYIAERLRISGANGSPVFSEEAVEAIFQYSKGIPRVVNLLCEHSLINAYVDQVRPVPPGAVEQAARDFELDIVDPSARPASSAHPHLPGRVDDIVHNLHSLLAEFEKLNAAAAETRERKI